MQRGDSSTFALSSKSARDRAAVSWMPENCDGGRRLAPCCAETFHEVRGSSNKASDAVNQRWRGSDMRNLLALRRQRTRICVVHTTGGGLRFFEASLRSRARERQF